MFISISSSNPVAALKIEDHIFSGKVMWNTLLHFTIIIWTAIG